MPPGPAQDKKQGNCHEFNILLLQKIENIGIMIYVGNLVFVNTKSLHLYLQRPAQTLA